jgi:hypothetical protein
MTWEMLRMSAVLNSKDGREAAAEAGESSMWQRCTLLG